MGKKNIDWQDDAYVLKMFGDKRSTARRRYKIFVQKGIQDGKRPELTGGGLIRSSGGWSVIKSLRRGLLGTLLTMLTLFVSRSTQGRTFIT